MDNTTPNSLLKFYNTKIVKEKNMLIDYLNDYLATVPASSNFGGSAGYDFQWQRHEQMKQIKVSISEIYQTQVQPNYCTIKNSNESFTGYYFVSRIEQENKGTLRFYLIMDVLNTMCNNSSPFKPSAFLSTTQIKRQHYDRYKQTGTDDVYYMNIEKQSQEFSPILYRQRSSLEIYDGTEIDQYRNWYLLYTSEDGTSINTYMMCDKTTTFRIKDTLQIERYGGPNANYYALLIDQTGGHYQVTLRNRLNEAHTYGLGTGYTVNGTPGCTLAAVFTAFQTREITTVEIRPRIGILYVEGSTMKSGYITDMSDTTFTVENDLSEWPGNEAPDRMVFSTIYQYRFSRTVRTTSYSVMQTLPIYINDNTRDVQLNAIDLSKYNKLPYTKKIIRCAYCPFNFIKIADNHYSLIGNNITDATGSYEGLLKIGSSELQSISRLIQSNIYIGPSWFFNPSSYHRNINRTLIEPQIYHSDTYSFKLSCLDSSIEFKLENIDHHPLENNSGNPKVNIIYHISQEYGSSQYFEPVFQPSGYDTEFDFDSDVANLILNVNGNQFNQIVYNSDYLNYLETDYKYDKKSLEYAAVSSVIGGVTGVAAGVATGNPLGVASSIIGVVQDIGKQERAFDQNINRLQKQGLTTIYGSSYDVLEDIYGTSKLRKLIYTPETQIKNQICDIYYKYGLSKSVTGTPNVLTRVWFNFIQCTPQFNPTAVHEYPIGAMSWLNEVSRLFEEGVTVYHKYFNTWDFDQVKENWEVTLANIIPV